MVDPTLGSFSNAINSPSSFLVLFCLMMAYTAHMCSLWHELWNIYSISHSDEMFYSVNGPFDTTVCAYLTL